MEHRRDVSSGALCSGAAQRVCGGVERARGGAPLRVGPRARRFGLARETVRKMLRYRRPPGYRRGQPARRPKLDAFTGVIDQILREDQARPKKQRHTAKRIGERLRAEYGFTGGDTIVKAYVRAQRTCSASAS